MIASNIIGGLGNQMFQFACGHALARRLGQPHAICTDQFDRYKVHDFQLDSVFSIDTPELKSEERDRLLGWRGYPVVRQIIAKAEWSSLTPKNWLQEASLRYCDEINTVDSNCYLHGYWQSWRYFEDCADEIRQIFKFHNNISDENLEILSILNQGPSISVHVRRGDYFHKSNKILNCLEENYYLAGLKMLTNRFPGSKIFFFSDDPLWVRDNFSDYVSDAYIIDHNIGKNSYWDMMLMSRADHNIIANSSFSWWGAWLNTNKGQVVIAPKNWFLGAADKCSDLIPPDWIRI